MIKAIFYCQFLPRQGPTVLHQVPQNSISTTTTTATTPSTATASTPPSPPLLSFPPLSTHLIPRREFCNRALTLLSPPSSSAPSLRIISHPICIHDPTRYERNDFIFNFAIVVDAALEEWSGYRGVVRRLAGVWRGLEEWGGVLSGVGGAAGAGAGEGGEWERKVFAVMEQVLEDLNNYCECMIPIDDSTTINIKLFPKYPPPPPVKPYHVPISTVQLEALMDIIPHINGLNATSRLSALSSADPSLVKKSLSHLLYYNCLLMLDIFQYSAIYAVTAEISLLVADADVQRECAAYVAASDNCDQDDDDDDGAPPVDPALIISLYASLRQGLTLKAWCVEHEPFLAAVDVRRFISFGVIKGFLYRVHKYAVRSLDAPKPAAAAAAAAAAAMDVSTPVVVVPTGKPPARPSVVVVPGGGGAAAGDDEKRKTVEQLPLMAKYLDGTHCLDEICTDLGLSEKEVLKKLGAYGDVHIIHK